jgi:anthranilate/para-aminobenzoate synthase component I
MSIQPGFDVFSRHFDAGKTQLVWQWIPADLETPVSAFLKLSRDEAYSLLLESVEGGAVLGRYSAIGLNPDLIWKYEARKAGDKSRWKHCAVMFMKAVSISSPKKFRRWVRRACSVTWATTWYD